ncbi:hypothetical protein LUZ60_000710 [Juncus effusus]|nr:hypothetical protein LUZ60_000710 [Juncus effusus]
MEFSYKFTSAVRSHWRRQKYDRLQQGGKHTKKVARLGGDSPKPRRSFKLRSAFRIRFRILNPIRILARIRDAYVKGMLGLASKGNALSGPNGPESLWAKRIPRNGFAGSKPSEYEKRLITEIYNSLVANGEFVSRLRQKDEVELHAS